MVECCSCSKEEEEDESVLKGALPFASTCTESGIPWNLIPNESLRQASTKHGRSQSQPTACEELTLSYYLSRLDLIQDSSSSRTVLYTGQLGVKHTIVFAVGHCRLPVAQIQ
jgi:hypothetical protein